MKRKVMRVSQNNEPIGISNISPYAYSSVSFTWFALLSHQKFDDRPLFKREALCVKEDIMKRKVMRVSQNNEPIGISNISPYAYSSVSFTWFALLSHQKFDDRPLFKREALCLICYQF